MSNPLDPKPVAAESYMLTTADLLEAIRQGLRDQGGWPICYDDKAGVAIRELLRRLAVETEDE